MVSPSSRRRAITYIVGRGLGSATQSCRALGMARSSFYCKSRVSTERVLMKQRIIKLSEAHPRYGYRRIGALLRREGQRVNTKRVQRIRRQEGLEVRKKQRATRRIGISTATRRRAQRANQLPGSRGFLSTFCRRYEHNSSVHQLASFGLTPKPKRQHRYFSGRRWTRETNRMPT